MKKNLVVHKVITAIRMDNTKTFRGTTDSQHSANKNAQCFFLRYLYNTACSYMLQSTSSTSGNKYKIRLHKTQLITSYTVNICIMQRNSVITRGQLLQSMKMQSSYTVSPEHFTYLITTNNTKYKIKYSYARIRCPQIQKGVCQSIRVFAVLGCQRGVGCQMVTVVSKQNTGPIF